MRSSDVSGCRPGVGIVDEFALGRNGARRPDAGGRELPPAPAGTASAAALAAIFRHHPIRRPAARRLAAARAGRRCFPAARPLALLSFVAAALALLSMGPLAAPAAAQEVVEVPRSWALTPPGLGAGDTFRLLFVTSTKRNALSTNIGVYNGFVQGRAGAGHAEIRDFSSKFKVVGSTSTVNARNNTATTYTSSNKGVPIWWLNGDRVADDYEDFYDGSWDNRNGKGRNESGTSFSSSSFIWTGSNNNGTKSSRPIGSGQVTIARLATAGPLMATLGGTGQTAAGSQNHSFFALSPVIRISDTVKPFSVSITSTPADAAAGYAAGETVRVRVDFGEAVAVQDAPGKPYLVLDMAGVPRRAVYESGSGTRFLVFAYPVVAADFDSDGVSLCSNRALDAGCGRITLAGGSIRTSSDSVAVELGLPELDAQSGHKVDGQPDFTAPPGTVPMADPGAAVVPPGWSLIPSGLGSGRYFRLLFVSSTGRDATSSDINDYNNHVIANAGAGHTAIRAFKDGFRVIASTEAVDARDNAGLTGAGVPVYWLNGAEVADTYADLLDGSWDSEAWTTEAGGTASSSARTVWTGSTNAGVERFVGSSSKALGSRDLPATAALGELNKGSRTPLAGGFHLRTESNRLYGMSQLLRARPRFASLRLASTPRSVNRL